MTDEAYFFDTYALVEVLKRNPKYAPYLDCPIATTKLNLFELYCALRRDGKSERDAADTVKAWAEHEVEFAVKDIEPAGELWLSKRKMDLSMTDCIGYVV